MSFTNPIAPNLADFITFCQAQGVSSGFLDPASPYYEWALTHAINTVYTVPEIPGIEYVIAVYNWGMHWLVCNAQDASALTISSATWTSGAVVITPAAALSFPLGTSFPVVIGGFLPLAYNGTYTAQVLSGTTFAYALDTNPGAATLLGVFGFQFFAGLRKQFNILSLVPGPVQSSGDQGTNQTLVVPDFFKTLTMADIDLMKTPWGQRYLAYAQKAGPTIVGLS